MHDKTETAFVQAMAHSKVPTHYLGMNSITGKSRSLFFTGYDSLEAWEKDVASQQKNAMLSVALDRAGVADGELLDSVDTAAFKYNAEYSLNQQAEHATRSLSQRRTGHATRVCTGRPRGHISSLLPSNLPTKSTAFSLTKRISWARWGKTG
jgi:hypothetical protein